MSLELAIQQNTEAILALTKLQQASYEQGQKAISLTESLLKRMHGDSAVAAVAPMTEAELEHKQMQERKTQRQAKPAAKATMAEEPVSTTDALPPAAEPVKAAAPVTAVNVTLADLQAEGKKLLDAGRQTELKQVVTDLKGTKLSLLPASDYPAALKALKALTAGL